MSKYGLTSITIKSLFISTILLGSLPAFSAALLTSESTFAEGDYTLNGSNGLVATGGGYGTYAGGDSIDTSFLPGGGSIAGVTGYAGSDLDFYDFFNDRVAGRVNSGAQVLDPLNQLDFAQADGEAAINFGFEIFTPHTYLLTGSTTVEGGGRVNLSFDSVSFTQLDETFSLTGTLAAGRYGFTSSSIAALGDVGTVAANYDFDLQLYEVAAVPVPAAVWLFVSGLMGLFGFSHTKKASKGVEF